MSVRSYTKVNYRIIHSRPSNEQQRVCVCVCHQCASRMLVLLRTKIYRPQFIRYPEQSIRVLDHLCRVKTVHLMLIASKSMLFSYYNRNHDLAGPYERGTFYLVMHNWHIGAFRDSGQNKIETRSGLVLITKLYRLGRLCQYQCCNHFLPNLTDTLVYKCCNYVVIRIDITIIETSMFL